MRGLGWRRRTCGVLRGQVGDSAADADGLATLEREDEKTPALGRAGVFAFRFEMVEVVGVEIGMAVSENSLI